MTQTALDRETSTGNSRRPEIKHFTWLSDWRASYELGIEVPSVCGRRWSTFDTPGPQLESSLVRTWAASSSIQRHETAGCARRRSSDAGKPPWLRSALTTWIETGEHEQPRTQRGLTVRKIGALLICGLVLLTGCGKSQQEIAAERAKAAAAAKAHQLAVARAAAKKQAGIDYAACIKSTSALTSALQDVQGQVQVGVTLTNYQPLVGKAVTTMNQVPAHSVEEPCYSKVLKPLANALIAYANAADKWNSCIQNGSSSCDPVLQRPWANADKDLTAASNGLAAMNAASK